MNRQRGKPVWGMFFALTFAILMILLSGCTSGRKEEEPGAGD